MAKKGYVYIMTTAVDGIIKIGRSKDWNRRCQSELEENGYKNMNALKTYFVAEVDDDNEIESIMHDIFRESRVNNTELFAVDKNRAKRVLSKMGIQVYPESELPVVINNTTAPSIYNDFWNRFNNELKKAGSKIKVKASCFNKHYYVVSKGGAYFLVTFKDNNVEVVVGSNSKTIFDSNIISNLKTVNKLSDLVFADSSYIKTTGLQTYQIKAKQPFDINSCNNTDIKALITKIEPIYEQFI